jgi:hypothetical protein
MKAGGEFQTAANNGTFQGSDDRNPAMLYSIERCMPSAADMHEISRAAIFPMKFDKIESGAEMFAIGGNYHGPDIAAFDRREYQVTLQSGAFGLTAPSPKSPLIKILIAAIIQA